MKGRKRHVLVDTQGLVSKVKVLPANLSDAQGGKVVLQAAWAIFKCLSHLFIDGGYKRQFEEWVKETLGWTVQVMQRPDANFRGIWWPDDVPMPPDLIEELRAAQKDPRLSLFRSHPPPLGSGAYLRLAQLQPQTQPRL